MIKDDNPQCYFPTLWEQGGENCLTFKEERAQIMQLPPWKSGQSNWDSFVTPVFSLILPAIIGYFTKEFELKQTYYSNWFEVCV